MSTKNLVEFLPPLSEIRGGVQAAFGAKYQSNRNNSSVHRSIALKLGRLMHRGTVEVVQLSASTSGKIRADSCWPLPLI